MEFKKMPLQEQLKRAGRGEIIHPEYAACAIRLWAEMPIAAYMAVGCREAVSEHTRLMNLLGITEEKEASMTYRDVAVLIGQRKQQGKNQWALDEAVRLLAAPAARSYRKWKEAQDGKNAP